MGKKRILFVDDEAGFLRILKLTLPGYEVCTISDSLKAVEAAKEFKPDIVFLDVTMPKLDGGEVAAQMKDDPLLKRIPIVFLTATIRPDEPRPHSGEKFLSKPVAPDQIVKCIEDCLGP